jgi:hypothetical protein
LAGWLVKSGSGSTASKLAGNRRRWFVMHERSVLQKHGRSVLRPARVQWIVARIVARGPLHSFAERKLVTRLPFVWP